MARPSGDGVRARLLGSWRLVSCESLDEHGAVTYPLGEDAVGQLLYSEPDRVSAQLVRANQGRFPSDDWREANTEQRATAWTDYFGDFGRFSIDEAAGMVTHHIEAGWFPNLAGTQQIRRFRFDGSNLPDPRRRADRSGCGLPAVRDLPAGSLRRMEGTPLVIAIGAVRACCGHTSVVCSRSITILPSAWPDSTARSACGASSKG
jgi:hypothetical protein